MAVVTALKTHATRPWANSLSKRLIVDQNVQHGSHSASADQMTHQLHDVELDQALLAHFHLIHLQQLGTQLHQSQSCYSSCHCHILPDGKGM